MSSTANSKKTPCIVGFEVFAETRNFAQAREECKKLGLKLALPTSAMDEDAIIAAINTKEPEISSRWSTITLGTLKPLWIDIELDYHNNPLVPLDYTNWAETQPDNSAEKCVIYSYLKYGWIDRLCEDFFPYVCQFPGKLCQNLRQNICDF